MARHNIRRLPALAAAGAVVLLAAACTNSPSTGTDPTGTQPPVETAAQTSSPAPSGSATPGGTVGTTVQQHRLTAAAALEAAQAALEQCQADKLPFVSVAAVDRAGIVQVLLRGDNAALHTAESAERKAYTSAAFGVATSEAGGRISGDGATIKDLPGTMFLPGGVPVKIGDVVLAGIGVGGAPDGAKDEACASAGAEAVAR